MGKEFKIQTKLNDELINSIKKLVLENTLFDKKVFFENEEQFEFRAQNQNGIMPSFTLTIQADGIYICKHDSSEIWKGLDELKSFLDTEIKVYKLINYDD